MESESEVFVKEAPTSFAARTRVRKVSTMRPRRNCETEEEATLRRFHDAQRMARFRAKKRKQQQQQQQQAKCQDKQEQTGFDRSKHSGNQSPEGEGKYSQLLATIEGLGRDVRLSYAGSRSSTERLKSRIIRARCLVRECLVETRTNRRE